MRNTGMITLVAVVTAAVVLAEELPKHTYTPKEGYVPDEQTAIKIAVAVWSPIYGEEHIHRERPLLHRVMPVSCTCIWRQSPTHSQSRRISVGHPSSRHAPPRVVPRANNSRSQRSSH